MIIPSGAMRVLVATQPVDFRKGMDGLAALVRENLRADPYSGEIHCGDIPVGMYLCHKCDDPSCVNAVHLGTPKDNVDVKFAKRRVPDQRGKKNPAAKLRSMLAKSVNCATDGLLKMRLGDDIGGGSFSGRALHRPVTRAASPGCGVSAQA